MSAKNIRLIASNVTVTFGVAVTASTVNSTNFELRNSSGTLVPATVTYNVTTRVATLALGYAPLLRAVHIATEVLVHTLP